jgi:hypothetical protein
MVAHPEVIFTSGKDATDNLSSRHVAGNTGLRCSNRTNKHSGAIRNHPRRVRAVRGEALNSRKLREAAQRRARIGK